MEGDARERDSNYAFVIYGHVPYASTFWLLFQSRSMIRSARFQNYSREEMSYKTKRNKIKCNLFVFRLLLQFIAILDDSLPVSQPQKLF